VTYEYRVDSYSTVSTQYSSRVVPLMDSTRWIRSGCRLQSALSLRESESQSNHSNDDNNDNNNDNERTTHNDVTASHPIPSHSIRFDSIRFCSILPHRTVVFTTLPVFLCLSSSLVLLSLKASKQAINETKRTNNKKRPQHFDLGRFPPSSSVPRRQRHSERRHPLSYRQRSP
jgi:hypothetical protein